MKTISFILNHLGVAVAVAAVALSGAHSRTLQLTAFAGQPERRAADARGAVCEPGLTIELHQLTVEEYPDRSPRRFASDVTVLTQGGERIRGTVEVNKPLKADGWTIYQSGYGVRPGTETPYSVFLLVRDPWIGGVYLGIFLLLAGALCLLVSRAPGPFARRGGTLAYAGALAGLTAVCALLFWLGNRGRLLVPALQSPWFGPHVVAYMVSYTLLGAATVMAVCLLVRGDRTTGRQIALTDDLAQVGLAFFTVGMLFGALWAKEAWGSCWSWDPKETWAAATWLCYLVYLHLRKARPGAWRSACIILLVSFACLQMCWWGINCFPSLRGLSVHTYNVG